MGVNEEKAVICWHCQYIASCNPSIRPAKSCENFKPLGQFINHQHVADWIGISRQHLHNIINRYGIDKVIELLAIRGHEVRYELVNRYIKFYEITQKDYEQNLKI